MKHISNKNKSQYSISSCIIYVYIFTLFFDKFLPSYIYYTLSCLIMVNALMKMKSFYMNYAIKWQLFYALTVIISFIPSLYIFNNIKTSSLYVFSTTFVLLISLNIIIENNLKIDDLLINIIRSYSVCGVLFSLFIIVFFNDALGVGRLGSNILSKYFSTATTVSYYAITSSIATIWLIINSKKHKFIYLTFLIPILYIALLTGTQKAVLLPIIFLLVYFILQYRKSGGKSFIICITLFISLFILYYLINNVPQLYNSVGIRLEASLNELLGKATNMKIISNLDRMDMIKYGFDGFLQHPIFGYGIGQSSQVLKNYSIVVTYAHNNYIDMLLNGGVVMFVAYYWIHIYLIRTLTIYKRKATPKQLTIVNFFIAMLVTLLLSDFGTTSFHLVIFNLFIVMASCLSVFIKRQNEGDV